MQRLKSKRSHDPKTGQKVLLSFALIILLGSRILSSVATIQDVQASFPETPERGDINLPAIELQDTTAQAHIATQSKMAGDNGQRLRELSEHKDKVERVRAFYARWNAPMADHADYIVTVSEQFGLDWRLIPSISIVESSGGKFCFKPYNFAGWGKMGFNNFEEAIYTVAAGLASGYRTSNPYAIAPKYNTVTPSSWANKVSYLMTQV